MLKKFETSIPGKRATHERSGLKFLFLACSCSALLSACVGIVEGTDGAGSGDPGVATAGSSSSSGNSGSAAGSGGSVSGTGNASAGNSNGAGDGVSGSANSFGSSGTSSNSFAGSSFGGSSFGGSSFGGSNSAGNGAGGRAGAGGRNGGNGGASNGGASNGGASNGGTSSAGTSSAGTSSGGMSSAMAVICTSNTNWTSGNGANMRPGNACRSCHNNFTVAGTIYPTAHEPNNCNGINGLTSGVKVMIKGANGTTVTLTPGSTGNFYSTASISKPYTVTLSGNGTTRTMMTAQSNGDCNSCHTQNGTMAAPGRIMSP